MKFKAKNAEIIHNEKTDFTYRPICPYCGNKEKAKVITCEMLPLQSQSIAYMKCSKCGKHFDVILDLIEK